MANRNSVNKNSWVSFAAIFVIIFLISRVFLFSGQDNAPALVTTEQFAELIGKNQVQKVIFYSGTNQVVAQMKAGAGKDLNRAKQVTVQVVNEANLEEIRQMVKNKVEYAVVKPLNPGGWLEALSGLFSILFPLILIWWFISMMRGQAGGAAGGFGGLTKSKAKIFQPSQVKVTFADVAGCEEAKEELKEVVEFLKNPTTFTLVPKVPKGVLLFGKPGTGKTLLARAVAGEANVPFLTIGGSDFNALLVGVGTARANDLFATARKLAPCIIFIDELDSIGKSRGMSLGGGHEEREHTLNTLLSEMDGFEKHSGIIMMAATNRPDLLDSALVRPGRFDRHIDISLPNIKDREAILEVHAKKTHIAADVDFAEIAKDTTGMSGADLENIINESALLALRRGKKAVEQIDLYEAVDKIVMGPAKKSMRLTPEEKNIVVYHEAGHAVTAILTKYADPVHKITIIPRGPALGFVRQAPENDCYLRSKEQLLAEAAVCLGGRAAEEVFLQTITSGAKSDLERATNLFRQMIYELGMDSEVGLAVYKVGHDFWGNVTGVDASEKTKERLEQRVKDYLDQTYASVKKLLEDHREKFEVLVAQLQQKETLIGGEVRAIFNLVGNPAS